jgi:hypothetical protein
MRVQGRAHLDSIEEYLANLAAQIEADDQR